MLICQLNTSIHPTWLPLCTLPRVKRNDSCKFALCGYFVAFVSCLIQCDHTGRFLKSPRWQYLKRAEMNCDVLGYFKQQSLSSIIPCGYFRAIFAKNWATFYFNIWSQWFGPIKKQFRQKSIKICPKIVPFTIFASKMTKNLPQIALGDWLESSVRSNRGESDSNSCMSIGQGMELFSRRRWTAGSAQQSNMYGMMACMYWIIFGSLT